MRSSTGCTVCVAAGQAHAHQPSGALEHLRPWQRHHPGPCHLDLQHQQITNSTFRKRDKQMQMPTEPLGYVGVGEWSSEQQRSEGLVGRRSVEHRVWVVTRLERWLSQAWPQKKNGCPLCFQEPGYPAYGGLWWPGLVGEMGNHTSLIEP